MTDTFTKSERSEIMSRISSKHTSPEIVVRKALYRLGFRYRLHDKKLPGKPDIVIKQAKTAIFVNGCFWHQHKGCKRRSVPKSNLKYWKGKLKANVERQRADIKELKRLGWKIFIVWECEAKREVVLVKEVNKIYEKIKSI